ncbi:MAG: alpha/beta hydrolase [Pseudonocardia sp.]|nr:alpha/beta hydrolase [Pseudonocardia sp.]
MSALHVHHFGPDDGRPVVALHGVTGHARRWAVLAEQLPELRLIAVDLRGHGHSPMTPPWGFEQHVSDVLAVLDDHGLDRAPLLGHSFGGAIALHVARTARDRVETLVLVDPAIGLDPEAMLQTAREACAGEFYPDREAARVERAQRWEGVAEALVDAELEQNLVQDEDGRWRPRWSTPAVVAAWSEMARPAITPPPDVPTLLLPAAKVDYVNPAWVERVRAELGDRLVVREMNTAHMVYLEQPAETAAAIRAFLLR